MSKLNIPEIPSKIINSILHETIESELKSADYQINVTSASEAGESNFMGIIYRVSSKRIKEDKNESDSTSALILKVSPQNIQRRIQFHSRELFLREIFFYDVVFPCFRQFEESKGVSIRDKFTEYPKCYRTSDVEPDECILLEDLKIHGFKMIDKYTEEVTVDHVRLFLQALAKFHAISFALRDQHPDKFQELSPAFHDIFWRSPDEVMQGFYDNVPKTVFQTVSAPEDAQLMSKVKKLFEKGVIDIINECIDSVKSATVISHGDTNQNNSMFRYDSDGKPIEICLVDFQITRLTSPILDIVYFLFPSTTKELRDEHYENLLKTYHETLSDHIRRLGSDPEKLYPYKMMLEDFRKFGKFGLICASLIIPLLTTDVGHKLNLDEFSDDLAKGQILETNPFLSESSVERFSKRMRDVIVDMDRLGYI